MSSHAWPKIFVIASPSSNTASDAHATLGSYREMIDLLKNSKCIKN